MRAAASLGLIVLMTASSVPAVCASMMSAQEAQHECCAAPEEETSCADLCAGAATPQAIDTAPSGPPSQPVAPSQRMPTPPLHLKVKGPTRLAADDPSIGSPPLKRYLHSCTLRL